MRLLLISNSTNAGEPYLEHPKQQIRIFLGNKIKKVLFIPFAAVTFTFDEYAKKVREKFVELGYEVDSIHNHKDTKKAVNSAEAIVVGGGNTFQLLKYIQIYDLVEVIRYRVLSGAPYIGWSAGSNITCPTICTTNDMPITEPENFNALNLVRFQINPHYIDGHPEGHAGETREERLNEFLVINPDIYVAGLREGSIFIIERGEIKLLGPKKVRIFKQGMAPKELGPEDDFDFLFD